MGDDFLVPSLGNKKNGGSSSNGIERHVRFAATPTELHRDPSGASLIDEVTGHTSWPGHQNQGEAQVSRVIYSRVSHLLCISP